eukprot:9421567-Pyramimonas_sp.AAC.1
MRLPIKPQEAPRRAPRRPALQDAQRAQKGPRLSKRTPRGPNRAPTGPPRRLGDAKLVTPGRPSASGDLNNYNTRAPQSER